VLYGLGISRALMRHGVTPELRIKVRNKELTARERVRYRARARWRRRLCKKFAHKGVAPPLNKILTSAHGFKPGHDGVDLICNANAPIMALCDAEVIDVRGGGWWGAGARPSHGHAVSEGDGIIQLRCLTDVGPFRKGMHFGYGHAEHPVVRKGQKVKAGELIGKAGFANAWHVHFMANGGGTMRGVGDRDPMPFVNYAMKRGR
jgi:murein DD-endopeptidase MepM/ murein hydrolase activator NlpD